VRHVLSIEDLSDGDLHWLVTRGAEYSSGAILPVGRLRERVIGIYFRKTSTRTRTAFWSGALRMGAQVVSYGPNDLQVNTGETVADTARVLSGMLHALVVRTAESPSELRELTGQRRMAVINAMSADEHPTQAISDLTTMLRHFGALEGIRVLYIGEGNNTAVALAYALARCHGAELHLRTPAGYGLPPTAAEAACRRAREGGGLLREQHSMSHLPEQVDVVYTTRWRTTGTVKPRADWRTEFDPYRVDDTVMSRYPNAAFMHDLPAHRGEEVAASVLDGQASVAFPQAENKLYSAMAVLEWCLEA
jgi:ornithine carbamoyltransferase